MNDDRNFMDALARLSLQVARAIIWHERGLPFPKPVHGASCFFLRLDRGVIGITANHVVGAFESAFAGSSRIVCQLNASPPFDLLGSIIARDDELDLATFTATDETLASAGAVAIDCRGSWPPPLPEKMRAISICGFPEEIRTTAVGGIGEFRAYGGFAAVEDVTERDIIVKYEPAIDDNSGLAPKPPLGFNMSGCSGGPGLIQGTRNGLYRWFPVGMIVAGPRGAGSGLFQDIDVIHLRRIDFINQDGTIGKTRAPS